MKQIDELIKKYKNGVTIHTKLMNMKGNSTIAVNRSSYLLNHCEIVIQDLENLKEQLSEPTDHNGEKLTFWGGNPGRLNSNTKSLSDILTEENKKLKDEIKQLKEQHKEEVVINLNNVENTVQTFYELEGFLLENEFIEEKLHSKDDVIKAYLDGAIYGMNVNGGCDGIGDDDKDEAEQYYQQTHEEK